MADSGILFPLILGVTMQQVYIHVCCRYFSIILYSTAIHLYTAQGLVLPEERTIGQGCITAGKNISYQCTVTDPTEPPIGLTQWSGSAFKCSGTSDRIQLQHSEFHETMPTSCGSLRAMALEVEGNRYLSQLSFTASTELNGKNISCSLSDDMTVIGSDTLIVGGK